MDIQCKKLHWSIYSAQTVQKKQQQQFTYGQTVQKNNKLFTYGQTVQKTALEHLQCSNSAKNNNSNLHMDDSAKKAQQFTYGQYILQTVQKTMCKIHIHILSTLSVL